MSSACARFWLLLDPTVQAKTEYIVIIRCAPPPAEFIPPIQIYKACPTPSMYALFLFSQVLTAENVSKMYQAMTFEKDMYALPDVSTSLNFRAATRASPDHLILMIDFHQLELRIVAHLSRDTTLHRYFAEHPDVFQAMADAWFGVSDTEAVQQEQRAKAKRTTYAILYGTGAEGLAAALNVTVEEAHELITDFRTRYPGVTAMKDKIIADGRAHGYVETLSGRRRAMPNLTSPHAATASRGERIAVNTVIQGTASDIVKSGMLRVEAALQDRFAKRQPYLPRLILQIHDELLFDVPRSLLDEAATIIRATLEAVPHWTTGKLPFPIRIKAGPSWGELETYPATA